MAPKQGHDGKKRRRRSRWVLSVGAALAMVLASHAASAQFGPPFNSQRGMRAVSPPPPKPARAADLRGLFGVPVAVALVASDDPDARIRGLLRLGAIATPESIDALIASFDQGSLLVRDPRARLVAVRVLAPYAKREPVRLILVRELMDSLPEGHGQGQASPLALITRDTAALALARIEDKKATQALVDHVVLGGPIGEAATRALRAYPPASLDSFHGKSIAPAVATLLGDLGDLRAVPMLRAMLDQPKLAVFAAVALAKLGDETAVNVATTWIDREDPVLRRGAAEVLSLLGAPAARAAIERLLASDTSVGEGVHFALLDPASGLDDALEKAFLKLPKNARELRAQTIAALGRVADVPTRLEPLLADPDLEIATSAALAIARMPGVAARDALVKHLAAARGHQGVARRLVVRAGVVRALTLGETPEGLAAELASMLTAKDASDRAVAAFGLVALGHRHAADLVASKDDAVAIAAARGALARGDDVEAALPLLTQGTQDNAMSLRAIAGGVALLGRPDGAGIGAATLGGWAEAGGPLAPLAARALPSRDDEVARARIKRLLAGSDPVVRAHIALGLATDPEPDASALLASAYAFEEDASVRRAIVRSLARRTEIQRNAALELARDLDPDDGVRALARSALAGRALDAANVGASAPGSSVAWIVAVSNGKRTGPALGRVLRADGVAIPVVSDPDGVLLVPGLPAGPCSLVLAPSIDSGDAASP